MIFDPRTSSAASIAGLGWTMIVIAIVVCLLVFAYLGVGLFLGRRRLPRLLTGSPVEVAPVLRSAGWGNWVVIICGIVIPAIILLYVLGYTMATLSHVSAATILGQEAAGQAPLTVAVTGHDWWWEVFYPDLGITTANEIHIPTGRPVQFKVTSQDVIHSLWVPQINGKIDLIPGRTNTMAVQADQTGTFRGQCAEFCGLQHAHMIFYVVVQSPGDFDAWTADQRQVPATPTDSLVLQGRQVFLGSRCVECHTIKGTNASGTVGPDLTHLASRSTIGAGALPNTPGGLGGWIENSQAIKPGNKMPPMQLDGPDLQALLAYLETLK